MQLKSIVLLLTGLYANAVLAMAPFVIKDIRVEGIQRTEAGTVFTNLPVKVGDSMTDDLASQAIKALYGTGFFKDVRIEAEGDVLVVSHKATIRILLCALLGIEIGSYRDRITVATASLAVVEFHQHGPLLTKLGDRSHLREEFRNLAGT